MDSLPFHWFDELFSHLLPMVTDDGLARGAVFLVVAARLAGFFCIGPLLGHALLSWPVRLGLVALLTLIVAPGLQVAGGGGPAVRQVSFEDRRTVSPAGESPAGDTDAAVLPPSFITWSSPVGLLAAVLCDAGIGAALGLAVAIVLSGLKLGGGWLDRHSGLGIGSVLNPEYSGGGSATAELVSLFCVTAILVMQPVNGHLLVVRFVLDTFQAIPVGAARMPLPVIELLTAIVGQSLILGLRIALPFVVAMSLLDMTLGWVRRSGRWETAPVVCAVRAGASLLILAATLPGIHEAVTTSLFESLRIAGDFRSGGDSS
jgi:flagellar biosynthetic protein FliR